MISWEMIAGGAEFFHLDKELFAPLKRFYDVTDKDFLTRCCEVTADYPKDFPFQEAEKMFTEAELRKFLLLCIVAGHRKLASHYLDNGFPGEMLEDIRWDLRVWLDTLFRDYGEYGLSRRIFGWERECLAGEIKQFGRLQANDRHLFFPELSVWRLPGGKLKVKKAFESTNPLAPDLTWGDRVINIHVPAKGSLDRKACIKSLRKMDEFFCEFHPDYDYKAVVCYSWLLDEQFKQLLKPQSNIVGFQQLGHVLPLEETEQTAEVRWRIWGEKFADTPAEKLPVTNSMERSVAGFFARGGRFHEGLLIIFRDELPQLFAELD